MSRSIQAIFILVILLLLTACYPNLTGTWKLTSTTTSWGSYTDCGPHN